MTRRSIASVILFTILSLGIYQLIWLVSTKREMEARGAAIPTAWLLIIPVANIYWFWKWAGGVERATAEQTSQASAFGLVFALSLFGLGWIGMAMIQSEFNKLGSASLASPVRIAA